MPSPAIVWLRLDLRLADNPALDAAVKHGGAVIPVFIHDPQAEGHWQPGGASNWWLHHALVDLAEQFAKVGSPLVIRHGDSLAEAQAAHQGDRRRTRRLEPTP
jgi:deoxyribodipyrimidine photo-lyase